MKEQRMVEEVMKPIGYLAVYSDGRIYENGSYINVLYKSWSTAVSALKRGYAARDYADDKIRIIPVYA